MTEIALVFRRPPHLFFGNGGDSGGGTERNVLALRIQPDEGISLAFGSKTPGQGMSLEDVQMNFRYSTSFGSDPPDAYEHLLLDCFEGDSTLFARRDEVELAWEIADRMRQRWDIESAVPLQRYKAGTWGPQAAGKLPGPNRRWRRF